MKSLPKQMKEDVKDVVKKEKKVKKMKTKGC